MYNPRFFLCLLAFMVFYITSSAQEKNKVVPEKCGAMQRLEIKFQNNPAFKKRFEQKREAFNGAVKSGYYKLLKSRSRLESVATIPVVFHIVLKNPDAVTDEQIRQQLDVLNKDFAGMNADSTNIPSYFKSLYGKSNIQFCLAQRTPTGDNTSGIERIVTTKNSFGTNDGVKYASSGGANIWDDDKYFNVWICVLSNSVLGYATFPEDSSVDAEGVVIDYRSLPGGSYAVYNGGKTLTHETGHYFNLYHIWGDDKGACTGTDYIDDTPNQADASSGCYTGVIIDNCTTGGNGIMYQNYMDYSNDDCLVLFTTEQVERMEDAVLAYRSSLLTSDGCQPPVQYAYNAALQSIDAPAARICSSSLTPAVTIQNAGTQVLTSLNITVLIDGKSSSTYSWNGALAHNATAQVQLNDLTIADGIHTIAVYTSGPNNKPDEVTDNDTLTSAFQYYSAVATVSEGFENTTFPPTAWDIVNPDGYITWRRTTNAARSGNASVMINNFNYNANDQKDYLRFPDINIADVDSAFLSFYVAAATYTDINTANNVWDTLEVLVSKDCGATYTSIYKKYGSDLVTRTTPTTTEFVPTSSEWRKDSINLADYINAGNIMLAFRNTEEYENNIYLDDVNLRTVTINPNLKAQGFLVTPNPATHNVAVQFYPPPSNLKAIVVYSMMGQKIIQVNINGEAGTYYDIDLSRCAAGMYIVQAIFSDKVLTKKIIKL
ncbi:M43 family zinc metalloprotease [Parafilimonas sp.]|uniref:M43 family zinc metalloprotease n=1 Tax=Parafilimonas sp. TaxID=1969739 RepID=UPI003F808155